MSFGGTGTTTSTYAQVYNETQQHGLLRCAGIKNLDAMNSLTVRINATDAFGTVATPVEYVVLPGQVKTFNSFDAGLGLAQPWESMEMEVKDTVPGMHADFEWHVATS